MNVGIEAINAYCGQTSLNIHMLFKARGMDLSRFDNLLMLEKSVSVPCEDSVTNAVNAAKPIIDRLSDEERNRIELIIVASESGLDFGKSLATFIHPHLNLSKRCRLFEVKQACYGGTAALQMASHWIYSQASPGAKALIIATDTARAAVKMTYAEPSQGVAAVAILVSEKPKILTLDIGANGYHSYEVLDTCRPEPEIETGDPDLSLLSYLDCLEKSYQAYCECVEDVDIKHTFDFLVFHTPFAGMVKGAHRNLLRKFSKATSVQQYEDDFKLRVEPSLAYCVRVGNVYSASVYLALCGLIDHAEKTKPNRVGLFSYGSGCSSEFYSGVLETTAHDSLKSLGIKQALDQRYELDMATYDKLLELNKEWVFGVKNKIIAIEPFQNIYQQQFLGKGLLILDRVEDYHRHYRWS